MKATKNKKAYDLDDIEPELNADLELFVAVDTNKMDWVASPSKGVWRKRLELVHGKPTQLTTLVKFEPGSSFEQHGHPNGEELFILSGVFSDHTGDHKKGYYVRNPNGFHHAPWTEHGGILLVHLCQFQSDDERQLRIDTKKEKWIEVADGVSNICLHRHRNEHINLINIRASSFDCHQFINHVELFVLSGELQINNENYSEGTWVRAPASMFQSLQSTEASLFYLKTK